jgi:hypothetical protein
MRGDDPELIGLEAQGDGKEIVENGFDAWRNWEDQLLNSRRYRDAQGVDHGY